MCRIPYAHRIDSRYVFRRRVHFRNLISKPLALTLRTADPKTARRRAALLAARFMIVQANVETMLETNQALTGAEIETIFRQELEAVLAQALHDATEDAPWSDSVAEAAVPLAEAYRIARRPGRPRQLSERDRAQLHERGLGADIPQIDEYLHDFCHVLTDDQVRQRLIAAGIRNPDPHLAAARGHMLRATAEAWSLATRLNDEDVLGAANPIRTLIGEDRLPPPPAPAPLVQPQADCLFMTFVDRRFGDVIDEVIAELKADGVWKGQTHQQRRIMETFAWITGNRPLGAYNHMDPQLFKQGIQKIPASGFRFGSLREGNMARPFAEVVAELPPLTPEQRRNNKTVNRDLSFMATVAKHLAKTAWRPKVPGATVMDFATARVTIKVDPQIDLRPPWTTSHLECLFRSPLYTGGGGALHRLVDDGRSRAVWHDAAYFAPLIWYYTHACREEICGLRVDEVTIEHATPHFEIKDNDVRGRDGEKSGEKRRARRRKLPIHSELIRLGFLDYVEAIRREGHAALFPELYLLGEKRGGAHFYERAWQHMSAYIADRMPIPTNDRGKGPDIHSIRSLGSSFYEVDGVNEIMRADVMGHARATVNGKHYSKRMATEGEAVVLAERRIFVERYVPTITGHVDPAPIRLLPLSDRSRVGSPRTRKRRSDAGNGRPA